MIVLFLAGFFAGVAVVLLVLASLRDGDGERGGLLRHDTPEARRVFGGRPW